MIAVQKLLTKRQQLIVAASLAIATVLIGGVFALHGIAPPQQAKEPQPVSHPPVIAKTPVAPHPTPLPVAPQSVPDAIIPTTTNGIAPVLTRIKTKQPVVFLGIDDGAYKDPKVPALLAQYHIKASLFLSDLFIHSNPQFFAQLTARGDVIEDHTVSHDTKMSSKSYTYQKQEICGMADLDEKYYGKRPTLFRPPGGAYSLVMQQAAAACGMKAIVTWIAKSNGGSMQYQIGHALQPGDIVLMHFRSEFKADLEAFVAAENAAGLHTELLEDWIAHQPGA